MLGEEGGGVRKKNKFGVRPELDHLTQVKRLDWIWSTTVNHGKV